MRSALITRRERLAVREFPEPQAWAGAAVIQIERCGHECSGSQAAMDTGFDLIRPGGACMLIRMSASGVRLDSLVCITKESLLDNSTAHHHHEFRITIDLMRDARLRTEPSHSPTVSLAGLGEAFASLALGREAKILVAPAT